jgi:predicted sugar kinase
VLLGLLPALREADLENFSEALYDFNGRVGAGFAPVQFGTYTSAQTAELITYLRRQGIRGVGQSSWGPTIFAVVSDAGRAEHVAKHLHERFAQNLTDVIVTRASNHGARCWEELETTSV